jgi:hypothetical protein
MLFSACESTKSYDHSPDWKSGTGIPINPCVKGTVFPRYGNLKPVPIPGHTHDPILTVLPVPLLFLSCRLELVFNILCFVFWVGKGVRLYSRNILCDCV